MDDQFGFTKVVVADLEGSAAFYSAVFGMTEVSRVTANIAGRRIDEIMYAPTSPGGASFVLLAFADQTAPANAELILGFVTEDLAALVDRVTAAGGSVVDPARDMPEHGVRVAFIADPEGHLIEAVQLLGAAA